MSRKERDRLGTLACDLLTAALFAAPILLLLHDLFL